MLMNYLKVAVVFALAFAVNVVAPDLLAHMAHLDGTEAAIATTLWCLGLFLVFGWACSKAAEGTLFPSFTLQLLVGIVLHDALAPLSAQLVLSVVVCTALAAIILKSGGDEIERQDFLKIAWPTVLIATVGYLVTFFVMFPVLMALGLDSQTAALLSAIALRTGQRAAVSLSDDRDGVRVVIDDDGPGIPAAQREEVFKPFLRLDASRNVDEGGSGLDGVLALSAPVTDILVLSLLLAAGVRVARGSRRTWTLLVVAFLLLAVVALIIDRRAMLVSCLVYLTYAVGTLFSATGIVSSVSISALIVGAIVLSWLLDKPVPIRPRGQQ